MLLSSLLFSLGFYLSAVYIARDSSIRKQIRSIDRVEFLQFFGHAQMEIEIEKKVERIAKAQQQTLKEESGINSSTTVDDYDIKLYIDEVLKEVKRKPTSAS
jgi:hypothetical protein